MQPSVIYDIDDVLEEAVEIRVLGKSFVVEPMSLEQVAQLTKRFGELTSMSLKGTVTEQYAYVFCPVIKGLTPEDVGNLTAGQTRKIYRILLEKIAGRAGAERLGAADKIEDPEKKKTESA